MSHIDEALRRAIGPPADKRPADREVTLDEYPQEPSAELPARRLRPVPRLDEGPAAAARAVPTHERDHAGARARDSRPVPPARHLGLLPTTVAPSGLASGGREPVVQAGTGLLRQYRRLAESLHQAHGEGRARRVLVTSVGDEDGKARAALDLALTLTRTFGTRGLIVDADLREPRLHLMVDAPNDVGLGDLLRGDGRDAVLVQLSSLLHLLPAGSSGAPSTAELTSETMRALLDEAAGHYDWVVVNGPCVSPAAGGSALAHVCDSVVFVVDAAAPFPAIERAIGQIGRERVIGTVLNGLDDAFSAPQR